MGVVTPTRTPRATAGARAPTVDGVQTTTAGTDAWPHTPRLLPWAIAGFMSVLWLTPFDAITVPSVPLPVEATLDRLLFPGVVGLWLAWILVGRGHGNLRSRITWIDAAMFALVWTALISVVLNAQTLVIVDEFELSVKKLAILLSLVLFYYVVATAIRPSELRAFSCLLVGLATVAALGVIYEYRSGNNLFYDWSTNVLPGFFSVDPAPADPKYGRESVTGPTAHAIAIATALAMALPLAFAGYMRSSTTRERVLHAVAITIILAGCIATVRRTGALGPGAALLVLVLYRPRYMLRLLPLGVVVVLATQVLAPSAPTRVKAQFVGLFQDNSVQGRTSDYDPVMVDVRHNILFGRGYGSYDPSHHRFLDNEWLGRLIETGIIGAIAYLLLILAIMRVAHRASRSDDPVRRAVGVAVVAGAAVYAVTNAVFDALAFPQAPYMLFFLAALATVASDRSAPGSPVWRRPKAPASREAAPTKQGAVVPLRRRAFPAPVPSPDRPDLSVVIVTHNGRDKSLRTLESASQAVGTASVEWFVVDCGSTDGTPETIEEICPHVTLSREHNVGFAAGANIALHQARGRYVLLLNPDVEIIDGTFSDIVTSLDLRPEVGAAGVLHQAPDGHQLPSMGRRPSALRQAAEAVALGTVAGLGEMVTRASRYASETSADWLVGAFLVLRREAIEEVGGLDERFFLYCEEKDWCQRARNVGWDVRHLPVVTIVHDSPHQTQPVLRAQLTYAKLQYARKHLAPPHRMALQAALILDHAVRIVRFVPSAARDKRLRERVEGERRALTVALGARGPRFPGARG